MGAWGTGPFDNDDAMDFVGDLTDEPASAREVRIRQALDLPDGYLDAPDASEALAAAALLVAARHTPPGEPEEVQELIAGGGVPTTEVDRESARRALARIVGEDSEWRELWEEAGSFDQVNALCADLSNRL
jgi:hypothetical protein